jgi:GT2 family glycosyltransferase
VSPGELTLVICTRDRPDDVVRAVASALRLMPATLPLLVVDQSTDGATQAALAPLCTDSRLAYHRAPAVGLGAARNIGVQKASTRFVAFTDDDCEIEPGFCEEMLRAFVVDPRVGMVFGSVLAGPHDSSRGFIPTYRVSRSLLARSLADKHRAEGIGACMGVTRELWRELGGFDVLLGAGARFQAAEDTDLALRCLASGHFIHQSPAVAVVHHGFRTWSQGKALIPTYLYGIGAMFGKHVACGRLAVGQVAARLALRWAFSRPAVEFAHRPPRLSRLAGFVRGFVEAVQTPVDRDCALFKVQVAEPPRSAPQDAGRVLTLPRILALALVLRLAVPALAVLKTGNTAPLMTADSLEYLALGEGLGRDHVFANAGGPELYRLPGYPLLVGLASLLGSSIALTILLQALLGTAAVALCGRLATCCGPPATRLAALFCALDPLQILWGGTLMAETLLTVLVALCVLGALRFFESDSWGWARLAALAAGAATIVKPVAIVLPVAVGLWLVLAPTPASRRALRAAALVVCVASLTVGAWTVRNGLCCGAWTFTLQFGHAVRTAAYWTAAELDPRAYSEKRAELSGRLLDADPQRARAQEVDTRALAGEFSAGPDALLVVSLRGLLRTLFHPGALAWLELFQGRSSAAPVSLSVVREGSLRTLVEHTGDVPLLFALVTLGACTLPPVVFALLAGLRPRTRPRALLLAVSAGFVLAGAGAWGQSRLRVPVMPLVCALAASEVVRLFQARSPGDRGGNPVA